MKKTAGWLIGCSGFSYKDWKSVFYPEGLAVNKWLDFYSEHFNTLESNVTFYRTPQLKTLQNWFVHTPEDFIFSLKAPRLITHYKKMNGTKELVTGFYDLAQNGLQQKLGAILFQLPPVFFYTEQRLVNLLEQLDASFDNVVEFRHASWWQEEVFSAFREKNITFCSVSHPSLPDKVIRTSKTIYFRFHGVPELYRSAYSHVYLDKVASDILNFKNMKMVYLYFNNTIAATAINNAKYLQKRTPAGIPG